MEAKALAPRTHFILFCFAFPMSPIFICCSSPANTPICAPGNVLWKLFSSLLIFLTSLFFSIFFFHLHQTLIWFFHISFLCSLSLSLSYSSPASNIHCSFVHIFPLLYHSFFYLALSISRLCFFIFFLSGKYCGWRSTVHRHCSLSVCMCVCVCLVKDMLLTLWLSFMWQYIYIYIYIFDYSICRMISVPKTKFKSTLDVLFGSFSYVGSADGTPMTNLFAIPASHSQD